MNHLTWTNRPALKQVRCIHTNAEKYLVNNVLTADNIYEVKNETDDYYFIVDNSGKVGGFYKEYFEEVKAE